MPLTYTNRRNQSHYFRAVETAKGGTRYYIVKSDQFPDLIEEVPRGFEIHEQPAEARVVLRKVVPTLINWQEKELVENAVRELSALKDIVITAEKGTITVWHSQFNSISGQEEGLSAEEAEEIWGDHVKTWKQYDDNFQFVLIEPHKRIFQAERRTYFSIFGGSYAPIEDGTGTLEELTEKFCPYMGRDTYFNLVPEGFEE